MLNINRLEHVLIAKVMQLFRNMPGAFDRRFERSAV